MLELMLELPIPLIGHLFSVVLLWCEEMGTPVSKVRT